MPPFRKPPIVCSATCIPKCKQPWIRRSRRGWHVPNSAAKTAGIDLGNFVAQQYIASHQNDGWNLPDAYTPTVGPGHWSTDPMVAPNIQKGWGSDWGSVNPWAMPNPDHFDSATPFTSQT